jgi:restriction endonuclease S subunit
MPKINRDQLFAYKLHYPSLADQDLINDLLAQVQAECAEMQHAEGENVKLFDELEQSVLSQAFRGEL